MGTVKILTVFSLGLNGGSLISSGSARSLYRQEILLLKGLALDRYLLRVQTWETISWSRLTDDASGNAIGLTKVGELAA